jgi:hypothetical protein
MWEADKERPCAWDELSEVEKREWDIMARAAMKDGARAVVEKPAVARTSAGLRDALFDAIDDVRSGRMDPQNAKAIAGLSREIINSVKLEVEIRKMGKEQGQKDFRTAPLSLGTVPEGE